MSRSGLLDTKYGNGLNIDASKWLRGDKRPWGQIVTMGVYLFLYTTSSLIKDLYS